MKSFFLACLILCNTYVFASDSIKFTIYFPFDKFEVSKNAKQQIDSVFKVIDTTKYAIKTCNVSGHTDQLGSEKYNDELSKKRAEKVASYVTHYIGKVTQNAYGKTMLLSNSYLEHERQLNRRVEILIGLERLPIVANITQVDTTKIALKTIIVDTPKYDNKEVKIGTSAISNLLKDTSLQVGSNINLPHILFIGGKRRFLRSSYPYLEELFYALLENKNIEVEIQGHICCVTGKGDAFDSETNKENLSEARAKAVYDFLVANGIDKSRLTYMGYGHQFPLTAERNEYEAQRNRRVEIKILKK